MNFLRELEDKILVYHFCFKLVHFSFSLHFFPLQDKISLSFQSLFPLSECFIGKSTDFMRLFSFCDFRSFVLAGLDLSKTFLDLNFLLL